MELIVITTSFPSNNSESYFEAELKQLSKVFTTIHVIRTQFKSSDKNYQVPHNVVFYEYQIQPVPLRFIPFINKKTRKLFFEEMRSIKKELHQKFTFFKYKIMHRYLFNAVHFSKWLLELIKKNDIKTNVIYTYWLTDFTLGSTLMNKNLETKYHIISRTHGWDCFYDRNPENYLPFRKAILRGITNIFPVSNAGTKFLSDIFKNNKIQTRYLGSAQFKQPESNPNKEFHILSIAFVSPIKQLSLLAQAICKLKTPVKWTHIGFNKDKYDRELLQQIEQMFDFIDNISFNPLQIMMQDEIETWISNNYVDVFCSTSKAEGLPVSMMQAQSAGIPIISTNVGGVSEIVIDNETGFLLPIQPSDNEIALVIKKFINLSDSEKQKLSVNSFNNFKKHFDAEKNFSEFAQELKNISKQQ